MQIQENTCLYHFPICPFCRTIRVMLEITGAIKTCYLKIEKTWEKREKFLNINPTGNVPLFVVQKVDEDDNKDTNAIWGYNTIIRYLNDKYPDKTLINGNLEERANILKYCEWFDKNFYENINIGGNVSNKQNTNKNNRNRRERGNYHQKKEQFVYNPEDFPKMS